MAHGTQDWWGQEPSQTIYPVQDVGELAVRLGSPDTHNRRGNVLFIDSFEYGLAPYYTLAGGTGSAVALSASTARNGAYSCKLYTGAEGGAYAFVQKFLSYPRLSRFGFEISFTVDDNAVGILLSMILYDGVHSTSFTVKYLPASNKWQYQDSAGAWQDLATGVDLSAHLKRFHTAKLVVDLETGDFVYFLYDDTEVSMAGIAGYQEEDATLPAIDTMAYLLGGAAAAATIYIDDVILTQNE